MNNAIISHSLKPNVNHSLQLLHLLLKQDFQGFKPNWEGTTKEDLNKNPVGCL